MRIGIRVEVHVVSSYDAVWRTFQCFLKERINKPTNDKALVGHIAIDISVTNYE